MIRRVGPWLRERIDVVGIVISLLLAALFSELGFESLLELLAALVIGAPLAQAVLDRLDPNPGLLWTALGCFCIAGGAVRVRDGELRVGVSFLAIGSWICLDGLYAWTRDESPLRGSDADDDSDEDLSKEEVVRLTKHNRRVVAELRDADRPLTTADLRERTGLDEDDLERVLARHDESGPIERVGTGYVLEERDAGLGSAVRTAARLLGGRLLRPFRLLRPSG